MSVTQGEFNVGTLQKTSFLSSETVEAPNNEPCPYLFR